MSNRHAVIMAGGSGTRFWPASRHARPKQLLDFWGVPMLRATALRLAPVVPFAHQWVITGAHLVDAVRELLPELPPEQIVAEPVGRNTAPCVGLAAALIDKLHGDATIGVFPADHIITGEAAWAKCLETAYSAAEDRNTIVTLGIVPTRPETGYGYIRSDTSGDAVRTVEAFVEKPDSETAEGYLAAGNYLWNGGIFVFKASTMLGEMERQLPELHASLGQLREAWGTAIWEDRFSEVFQGLRSVSIDYGVMEGARSVHVVPATFEWSDVGHWGALHEVLEADARGNVSVGEVLNVGSSEAVLINTNSEGKLLVALGLEGVVVVDTPDAVLVCPRERVQDVRKVVDALKRAHPEML